ncbi:hypothetical protein LEP1GSC062_0713 [Leptospira alexanderi serovar Manhao 3 str. L 60]|uniref:Uncharacterized protein n=1 Tax=Leptospira alexanderi serovar Manhao 3 str. L 60 TaxID=1049759 RepID=V6I234_9LEPT|nr:hypothetical protein LEP1GSC062_0713 [Leptospira alexanderi serovar Manhao 3 str. L 60]
MYASDTERFGKPSELRQKNQGCKSVVSEYCRPENQNRNVETTVFLNDGKNHQYDSFYGATTFF